MATYGLLNENNIIENIIELHPMNANEFPSAVPLGDVPAGIGDEYRDGNFYRGDEQVKSTDTLFNELLASEGPEVAMAILDGSIKEEEVTE